MAWQYPAPLDKVLAQLHRTISDRRLLSSQKTAIQALITKLDNLVIEIALLGLVSVGKTSILNALAGKKIGETGALHGVTREPSATELEAIAQSANPKIQLRLIDTPGLDEVDGARTSISAIAAAQTADLVLFVTVGELTDLERQAIAQLQAISKPMLLVVNKIDLYPQPSDLPPGISPADLVAIAASPLPVKVRITYAETSQTQEIWEPAPPQVQALKQRILDILNQDGMTLLTLNVLRSLAQIEEQVSQTHLQQLNRTNLALVFLVQTIGLALAPSWAWDLGLSFIISGSLFFCWSRGCYLPQTKTWGIAILVNAIALSLIGTESLPAQIGWNGISLAALLVLLKQQINQNANQNPDSAENLIQQILATSSPT